MKKRFYLIEPLDIDGDKNPDGFLISQYRIDKHGNKIFLKNKYVTYEYLKTLKKKNKIGGRMNGNFNGNGNVRIMSDQEYMDYLNYKNQKRQYQQPYSRQYSQQYQQPYYQQPPEIVIRNTENFTDSMKRGFGAGLGMEAAEFVGSGITNLLFGD